MFTVVVTLRFKTYLITGILNLKYWQQLSSYCWFIANKYLNPPVTFVGCSFMFCDLFVVFCLNAGWDGRAAPAVLPADRPPLCPPLRWPTGAQPKTAPAWWCNRPARANLPFQDELYRKKWHNQHTSGLKEKSRKNSVVFFIASEKLLLFMFS